MTPARMHAHSAVFLSRIPARSHASYRISRVMRSHALVLLLLPLLVGLSPAQQPPPAKDPPQPEPSVEVLHAEFDRLLKDNVREGLVDYERIRKESAPTLRAYLDRIAQADFEKMTQDERFSTYVNLYNATMIQAVLDHSDGHPDWTPAAADFGVFKEPRVRLEKRTLSLNELENDILRAQFKDARVHVALVCGARSCPPLLARAYLSSDLETTLTANLRTFLHDDTRNSVDHAHKTVRLSKIFEWYREDFGGESGIRKLLREQLGDKVATYRIEYQDYSWALNRQPPSDKKK